MEPYQIDNLISILRLVLTIGSSAVGASLVVYTWARAKRKFGSADTSRILEATERLHEAIDDLRAEQAALRSDVADRMGDISGRVEFTERLLTKSKE